MFYTVDKETKASTAEVKSFTDKKKDKNNFQLHKFDVSVDTINTGNGEVSMELTDKTTKQKHKVEKNRDNPESVKVQAQIAIPIIVEVLALIVEWLAAQLLYITIAGVVFLAAAAVISKVRNNTNNDYYAAYTVPGDDVYIGDPISFSTAVARLSANFPGNDVFSRSSSLAYGVAKAANILGIEPIGPELGSGAGQQYWHYHVTRNIPTHSFFLTFMN